MKIYLAGHLSNGNCGFEREKNNQIESKKTLVI
jgi:hypothetical protein